MTSSTTPSFWRAFRELPESIKSEAGKSYQLWKDNPSHLSLRFARKGDYWSVRITRGYRALASQCRPLVGQKLANRIHEKLFCRSAAVLGRPRRIEPPRPVNLRVYCQWSTRWTIPTR